MNTRIAVMHGVNLDQLGRRDPEHYRAITLTELEVRVKRWALELGLEPSFFQTNHEGEFCEELHRVGETQDGHPAEPGRVDALLVGDPRRARDRRAARRRGAPLGRRRARGVAARVGDPRPLRRHRAGQGRRRLPRGARDAEGRARPVSAARADRLAAQLRERELDALIVTNLVNVRWLTGFTGTNGVAVVGADGKRMFLTDFRYVERAEAEVDGLRAAPRRARPAGRRGGGAARAASGFEDHHLPVRTWQRLERGGRTTAVELVGAGQLLEELRAVKDAARDRRDPRRRGARRRGRCATVVLERGLAGRTEREVARAIERELRERGAEPSFPPIVAAAEHGALPHAEPRDVEIPRDTLVVVDWGALRRRLLLRLHAHVRDRRRSDDGRARGLRAGRARAGARRSTAVAPGAACKAVDAVARTLIADAGHGEHFGHGLGHGVGLEVHEEPRLTATAEGDARGRQRRHGRAGRLRARRARRADRGPRRRDRGRPRGPVRPAEGAHRGLESAGFWREYEPINRSGQGVPENVSTASVRADRARRSHARRRCSPRRPRAGSKTLSKPSPTGSQPQLKQQLRAAGPEGVQIPAERAEHRVPGLPEPRRRRRGLHRRALRLHGELHLHRRRVVLRRHRGPLLELGGRDGDDAGGHDDARRRRHGREAHNHPAGDGIPGDDFTLVRLDPAVVARWGVNPAIPVIGGPNGVYSGCGPETVRHYGHGYGVAVAQGKPEAGLATSWFENSYGWTGFGAPGDSGSPVVTTSGQAAGNFTHLIVHTGYPGSDLAGMRAHGDPPLRGRVARERRRQHDVRADVERLRHRPGVVDALEIRRIGAVSFAPPPRLLLGSGPEPGPAARPRRARRSRPSGTSTRPSSS